VWDEIVKKDLMTFDINDNLNILKPVHEPVDDEEIYYSVIETQPWAQQYNKEIHDLLWKTNVDEIEDEQQKETFKSMNAAFEEYVNKKIEEENKKIEENKNIEEENKKKNNFPSLKENIEEINKLNNPLEKLEHTGAHFKKINDVLKIKNETLLNLINNIQQNGETKYKNNKKKKLEKEINELKNDKVDLLELQKKINVALGAIKASITKANNFNKELSENNVKLQNDLNQKNQNIEKLEKQIKTKDENVQNMIANIKNKYTKNFHHMQDVFEKKNVQMINEKMQEFNVKYESYFKKLFYVKQLCNNKNIEISNLKKVIAASDNEQKLKTLLDELELTKKQRQNLENEIININKNFEEKITTLNNENQELKKAQEKKPRGRPKSRTWSVEKQLPVISEKGRKKTHSRSSSIASSIASIQKPILKQKQKESSRKFSSDEQKIEFQINRRWHQNNWLWYC